MINHLKLTGVGPAQQMEMSFRDRLNIFTGDNGLGKSFLLDVVWWALTRSWPAELNPAVQAGRKARPGVGKEGSIEVKLKGASKGIGLTSTYDRMLEKWTLPAGRPAKVGLVIYAMVDGSIAVWDPARNYWKGDKSDKVREREGSQPAYVFTQSEIWNGQQVDGNRTCMGFISDFSDVDFYHGPWGMEALQKVLAALSAGSGCDMSFGPAMRMSANSDIKMPTINMPYTENGSVPLPHVSSAVKRVLSLAYSLVWAWRSHLAVCGEVQGAQPTNRVVFMVDEIEAHLHPRWQRVILPALLKALESLTGAEVQLIVSTHSPLVMASCEDFFGEERDAWFDLDLVPGSKENEPSRVQLTQRLFLKWGEVGAWLRSNAFDLSSDRSLESEKLILAASRLINSADASLEEVRRMDEDLSGQLGDADPFIVRWRWMLHHKFPELA